MSMKSSSSDAFSGLGAGAVVESSSASPEDMVGWVIWRGEGTAKMRHGLAAVQPASPCVARASLGDRARARVPRACLTCRARGLPSAARARAPASTRATPAVPAHRLTILVVGLLGLDVDGALHQRRQLLVGLAFLIERLLQQARVLFLAELPRIRAHRAVAG